jgi:hypothetical protein
MKKISFALAVMSLGFCAASFASGPVAMTDIQMSNSTAGLGPVLTNFVGTPKTEGACLQTGICAGNVSATTGGNVITGTGVYKTDGGSLAGRVVFDGNAISTGLSSYPGILPD